jgi:hypothetical protein
MPIYMTVSFPGAACAAADTPLPAPEPANIRGYRSSGAAARLPPRCAFAGIRRERGGCVTENLEGGDQAAVSAGWQDWQRWVADID